MKVVIEYSELSGHYHFFPNPKNRGVSIQSTRKDEIEKVARKHGATEIKHKTHSYKAGLIAVGLSKEGAQKVIDEKSGMAKAKLPNVGKRVKIHETMTDIVGGGVTGTVTSYDKDEKAVIVTLDQPIPIPGTQDEYTETYLYADELFEVIEEG